ncbi:YciI family protein [Jatrophihabitans sp. YIM 134969]
MATYLALIHDPVGAWDDPAVRASGHAAHEAFAGAHGASLVGGAELAPDAVTLRTADDGTQTVTDGAYTEAKEVLGGFYVFAAPDREAAIEIGRDVPVIQGAVVLREVVDHGGSGERRWVALILDDEWHWTDPERAAAGYRQHEQFGTKYEAVLRGGHELAPSATATQIRRDGDRVTLTDGAFSESKEVLGGYYAFTADDLDAALAIAREVPSMGGTVELRPTGTMAEED